MMRLADPAYLWLAAVLLLPLLIRPRRAWSFSSLSLLRDTRRWSPPLLLIAVTSGLSLLALLLALARPQKTTFQTVSEREGRDIVLVLDVSLSMEGYLSQDHGRQQRRKLDVVREAALAFVRQHPRDRLGLIVFGDDAFGLWPLSHDHAMLQRRLERLDGVLPTQLRGTNFRHALVKALDHLRELGASKTRLLLMLTDGFDTIDAQTAEALVRRLRAEQVKLCVLGLELKEETPIVQLARRAQGRAYSIDRSEELAQALQDLAAQEPSRLVARAVAQHTELYPWCLAAGMALWLLATLARAGWVVEV
ncbi:MAG: VWA domain-containing protein [Candidatus Tectimicrobiota bacterium]|nr:MAG: VWA domain-containing protein [Candidatus Tectomicrobia bacterium]